MSHLFFSYSRHDTDAARKLIDELSAQGFVVWQDVSSILGGADWIKAIEEGVKESAGMILLWSNHSSTSTWVEKEIRIAQTLDKVIYIVKLDDTPLPASMAAINSLEADKLDSLFTSLPSQVRRKRGDFKTGVMLSKENYPTAETWTVDYDDAESTLIAVPLLSSSYSKAEVVTEIDMAITQPKHLVVCLQFSRMAQKVEISSVYRTFRALEPEKTFIALHITGTVDFKGNYNLNNNNPAMWSDAVNTTVEALHELSKTRYPDLHVFAIAPAVLTMAIGQRLWRFWQLTLYNFIGGTGDLQYARVMEILRDQK